MIPFAFHTVFSHVFSEPKKGLSLLIVVKRFMSKDRLRMEIGRIAALLDIDGPLVVRNSDDSSVVSSSDAPKFALRSDIGILQLEFVAMNGRLGGATSLPKEDYSGETRTFVEKILSRKIAKPKIFPPNGFLFATMPI